VGWGRRRGGRGMVAVESCRIERCFGPDCSGGSSQCVITSKHAVSVFFCSCDVYFDQHA